MSDLIYYANQVKELLLTSSYIQNRIKLQKKGREFLGLCPFHNEKTPSFTVNDQKQFFYCFGCQASGDIIKFVMLTENLDYVTALKKLAAEVNIHIPDKKYENNQEYKQEKILQDILYEINEYAKNWLYSHLHNINYRHIKEYVRARKIKDEIIEEFALGYFPPHLHLREYLNTQGFSDSHILEAGLIVKKDDGKYYDRFKGRLIFPIFNKQNKIVGFGGRIVDDTPNIAKYYNSPETLIFKKNQMLYGENRLKSDEQVILVEGYMDVLALANHGINYGVASLGTATNSQHILKMWKYSKSPHIALDSDFAGKRASWNIANTTLSLLRKNYSLKFVLYDAKDPDEYLEKFGKDAFLKQINNAKHLSDYIWDEAYKNGADLKTPEAKAVFEASLMSLIEAIPDNDIKKHYKNDFAQRIWNYITRNKFGNKNHEVDYRNIRKHNILSDNNDEKNLITLIIRYPELLEDIGIYEEFSHIEFGDKNLESLQYEIISFFDDGKNIAKIKELQHIVEENLFIKNIPQSSFNFDKLVLEWQFSYLNYHLKKIRIEYEIYLNNVIVDNIKSEFLLQEIKNYQHKIEEIKYKIGEMI